MIEHAALSEQGPIRDTNEDYVAQHTPDEPALRSRKGVLFVMADGVGGHRAGEVASSEAAQKLIGSYYTNGKKPLRALQDAFNQTNLHVYDLGLTNPAYRRMETTLSVLALIGNQVHIGHVGDTRIYRVRGPLIHQLTNDHSEVGELLRMQLITAEEARHHPRRNIITRTIGSELFLKPDFRTEAVEPGDIFVLCSDGLWEPVGEDEVADMVTRYAAEEACRRLIDLALARGTCDNVSVQVVKVSGWDTPVEDVRETKPNLLQRTLRFLGSPES